MFKYHCVVLLSVICVLSGSVSFASEYEVSSTDKEHHLTVEIKEKIYYSVIYKSKQLLNASAISLTLSESRVLGKNPKVVEVKRRRVDTKIVPSIPLKTKVIPDKFNEMSVEFEGQFGLVFKVYDDGVAYRFVTQLDDDIKVLTEEVTFNFADDYAVYLPEEEKIQTHSERVYKYVKLSAISDKMMCSLPALVDVNDGPKVLITEADLEDYPGMFLLGGGNGCNNEANSNWAGPDTGFSGRSSIHILNY